MKILLRAYCIIMAYTDNQEYRHCDSNEEKIYSKNTLSFENTIKSRKLFFLLYSKNFHTYMSKNKKHQISNLKLPRF